MDDKKSNLIKKEINLQIQKMNYNLKKTCMQDLLTHVNKRRTL